MVVEQTLDGTDVVREAYARHRVLLVLSAPELHVTPVVDHLFQAYVIPCVVLLGLIQLLTGPPLGQCLPKGGCQRRDQHHLEEPSAVPAVHLLPPKLLSDVLVDVAEGSAHQACEQRNNADEQLLPEEEQRVGGGEVAKFSEKVEVVGALVGRVEQL